MHTTYNLFEDLLDLRTQFEKFFDDKPFYSRRVDFPYVNVHEKPDELIIKAIVPGVVSDDLNIQIINNNLVIEGRRKSDYQDKPYIRKEREFGAFNKSIRLPYEVEREKINATLKDGILTVNLHKSEAAKPRKIHI